MTRSRDFKSNAKITLSVATNGLARNAVQAALDALASDATRTVFGLPLPPSWLRDMPMEFKARVVVRWEAGGIGEWRSGGVDLVAGRCATCGRITFGVPCESPEDQRRIQLFFSETPLLAWVCVAIFQSERQGWRADCLSCPPSTDARRAG